MRKIMILASALVWPFSYSHAAPNNTVNTANITKYLKIDITKPDNYAKPVLPAYYSVTKTTATNTPSNNPITDKGATLGRVLFYDKNLSINGTTSCASCHLQSHGFGADTQFSTGFSGQSGSAHSMRLGNVAYYRGVSMFWDKRAPTLESQSTQPIKDALEMGFDSSNGGINTLLTKMRTLPYYPELFKAVYGTDTISESRIQLALAQFMRSMVSVNSRWDQAFAKVYDPKLSDLGLSKDLPGFTAQENAGRKRFMEETNGKSCAGCHVPPTFTLSPASSSNGLDANETRVFKAPSLKNIAQGQPMMHDGRFSTFEEVVEHYNLQVKTGPALDKGLTTKSGKARVLNMTQEEKTALVAFLKTLEDSSLKTDARFSNPFK